MISTVGGDVSYGSHRVVAPVHINLIGNESVPKILRNNTINLFFNCNQHFGNFKP